MKRLLCLIAVLVLLFSTSPIFSENYTPIQISLVPGIALPFSSNSAICVGPIGNISGRVDLLQAAGVFNIASAIRGLQAAGVFNIAGENMEGIQAAGVFNIAGGNQASLQVGGVFNIASGSAGSQISGVFNIAGDTQGLQIGPVFNIAGDIDGIQVGLVNLAGKVRGIQVGLLSFSSNGVFDLELDWEPDTGFFRTSLETGNSFLFARYAVAAPKDELFNIWDSALVSAGLGTRLGDPKSLYLDLSVSASQAIGSDPGLFVQSITWCNGHSPKEVLAPWPTLEAGLSLKLGPAQLTAGLRTEVSLGSAPNLPSLRAQGWKYEDRWFGESFTAWTTWYLGFGF